MLGGRDRCKRMRRNPSPDPSPKRGGEKSNSWFYSPPRFGRGRGRGFVPRHLPEQTAFAFASRPVRGTSILEAGFQRQSNRGGGGTPGRSQTGWAAPAV